MALAAMDRNKRLHHERSWFVTHLLAACGNWKSRPDTKQMMKNLNAPVDDVGESFEVRSMADLRLAEEKLGIKILPDDAKEEHGRR
jgi:hypothetical protein